jgi:hypothetical protein
MEWAREGIVEALKARHFIYALMLRYFLWMGRLSRRGQWFVVIGGYFGYRILLQVREERPDLAPWITPITTAYLIFALMTWLADPLFNLLLRLNRFGRLALSRNEIVASNWIGSCLALALIAAITWAITGDFRAEIMAITCGLLMIPLAGTFNCQPGWPRLVMSVYTGVLAFLGSMAVGLAFLDSGLLIVPGLAFVFGVFLSSWVANALQMVRLRR